MHRNAHAHARGAVLVLAAALVAGCGSSSSATSAPLQAAQPRPAATAGPNALSGGNPPVQAPAASQGGPLTGVQAPQPAASAAASAGLENQLGRDAAPTPGDLAYTGPGLNPYVSTAHDHLSTFGLDVDTASYTMGRASLQGGRLPDPNTVRVEEWVNFFDQGYAPPEDGVFAIRTDGVCAPFLTGARSDNELLLRVGVQARVVSRHDRPDAALTFVIDTSGSMGDANKLEMVKSSLRLLVDKLRATDRVSIVAFTTDARVVLGPTSGDDRGRILGAIDELQPQATTNAQAGLRLGYELARETMAPDGINRVILASDGVANVGDTDAQSILESVHRDAAAGIQLVSIGVGMGSYNDTLLEQLADKGDGFYAYIDTPEEAHRLFVERLVSTLDTVALDAKAQIDFDPETVDSYRLIGYENRAIADQDFRNNSVPAGAIGAGHAVTVLYGVRLREGVQAADGLATVTVRWTDPATRRTTETSQRVTGSAVAGSWSQADPHLRLDALVAGAAETLRGSPWIEDFSLRQLADAGHEVREALPQTEQVDEFLGLLDAAARLGR